MALCTVRIALTRMVKLSPEAVEAVTGHMGPDTCVVLRATDIFGGRMDLGMRVTDAGLETVAESDEQEPEGDPVEAFKDFVSDGCSVDVLLFIPDGVQPPQGAFPANVEAIEGLTAYRIIDDEGEAL